MTPQKMTILTVDDNPDILDVLKLCLENEGYQVEQAVNGKQAIEKVKQSRPDLIILDYMMPEMNGHDVVRLLKKDILYQHIPVVMLTAKSDVLDKVKGIEAGVDDYVFKPFEPLELVAVVKMILRRNTSALDANPLTKLPGNISIKYEIKKRFEEEEIFAVCHTDLRQFKAYNDKYGFEKGDLIIKFTSEILLQVLKEYGSVRDFVGHIGGDDFILICQLEEVDKICQEIISRFDEDIINFYSAEDRNNGYIISYDRKGNINKFPIMTIYIAVAINSAKRFKYPEELGEVAAELGNYAKTFHQSIYIKDRRKE